MKKGYKKSPVLMKSSTGFEHMFESITEAAKFAGANSWTMSLKMEVFGYFEDAKGNKYYRQDKMETKNQYSSQSPKMTKNVKPKLKRNIRGRKAVKVDGIVFESITKAGQYFNINTDLLRTALKKGKKTYKEHTIEYADKIKDSLPIEMPKPIEYKQKVEVKDEKISIVVDSTDPAIKAINDKIVELLKKSGVYEEIKKLSQAIQKLSK